MRHKTFELIEFKADDDGEGQFTALASVFNNVDLVGDKMLPGAFTKTLEDQRAKGKPIPVILSHQWDDPFAYVGKADPAQVIETDQGLQVNGTLDLTTDKAKQVYSLMKQDLITGWSFGYTVPDGGEEIKDGVNEVSQVDLIEVGPTLKGANPEAQLQAIKALAPSEDSQVDVGDKAAEAVSPKADDPLKDEIESTWWNTYVGTPKGD